MANSNLGKAKENKNDEFYTQLSDIENELKHYRSYFKGKVVYCNCDDPYESNFFKYFALNFNVLGLKKLISVSYAGSPVASNEVNLFEEEGQEFVINSKRAYKVTMTELKDVTGDGRVDLDDVRELIKHRIRYLKGDGGFETEESIELLKEADIVVTNPPFSRFREYIAQLIDYDKKFIVIGNQNALTYKEIFPYFMNNKMWWGASDCIRWFLIPDDVEMKHKLNIYGKRIAEGARSRWFTNLDIDKRHEFLDLYKEYTPEEYPKYDNYDAIEVSKVIDIPMDYEGVMGVPITFLDKYCPEQFEIVGTISAASDPNTLNLGNDYSDYLGFNQDRTPYTTGKGDKKIRRTGSTFGKCPVLIMDDGKHPYYEKNGIRVQATYHRIFIRRKKVTNSEN